MRAGIMFHTNNSVRVNTNSVYNSIARIPLHQIHHLVVQSILFVLFPLRNCRALLQ